MKHPSEATLALHAGGDLGLLARWRTEHHLSGCGLCRDEVAALQAAREIVPELRETPELQWSRLAAEMRANIRLGLAAGECVRTGEVADAPAPWFTAVRGLVAVASVLVLMVTGLMLEHPAPNASAVRQQGVVVQRMANGIQVWEGGRSLELKHRALEQDVMYSVGAQGSMRARYVDPNTGYVTINNVYAE